MDIEKKRLRAMPTVNFIIVALILIGVCGCECAISQSHEKHQAPVGKAEFPEARFGLTIEQGCDRLLIKGIICSYPEASGVSGPTPLPEEAMIDDSPMSLDCFGLKKLPSNDNTRLFFVLKDGKRIAIGNSPGWKHFVIKGGRLTGKYEAMIKGVQLTDIQNCFYVFMEDSYDAPLEMMAGGRVEDEEE